MMLRHGVFLAMLAVALTALVGCSGDLSSAVPRENEFSGGSIPPGKGPVQAYGYVVDPILDRAGIDGAIVTVTCVPAVAGAPTQQEFSTLTDSLGFFLIDEIPEGAVTISIKSPEDYQALTETVEAVGVNRITCSMATYRTRDKNKTPDSAELSDDFLVLPEELPPGQLLHPGQGPGLEKFEKFLSYVCVGQAATMNADGSMQVSSEEGDVGLTGQYKDKKSNKKAKVKKEK